MHLNSIYSLQSIAGENFIFVKGEQGVDMTRIVSLSPSAAWLWKQLYGKEFALCDAVQLLTEHYDLDTATASRDVNGWIGLLLQNKLVEE